VSMKEIAKKVGVSQSTVSRILSGAPIKVPVALETRQRIMQAVKELGYRPNPLARGLRGGGTGLLGLIVREVGDPFFACAIDVIAREARLHDYSLVLGHAHGSADEALALTEVLETRHCDGIILLGDIQDARDVWGDLIRASIPLIGLCQGNRAPGIPTINADNKLGVTLALDYLFELGHRDVAYIDAGSLGDIADRQAAYLEWMDHHHIAVREGRKQPGDNEPGSGVLAFERLMALHEPPTAVLCATDQIALGVLSAAAKLQVNVPGYISVVGFDDIPIGRFAVPSLTTVRQPIDNMARLALAELLKVIRREEGQVQQLQLCEPQLIVRDSSGPSARPNSTAHMRARAG